MSKYPIINDQISKSNRDLYKNMRIVSDFVNRYRYYLNINEKILLEIKQILNSINIILSSGVIKPKKKRNEIDEKNQKATLPEDKCLINIECAKVELIKNSILNFDKIEAKKIIGCTNLTIRDIENQSPKILKLIEELQTSFVEAISGEKKQEKITKIETTNQTNIKTDESDTEIITMEDWKNPEIQKDETSNFEATSSETISQEYWKQETNPNQESIEEELIIEDPNTYYRNFNSGNIDEIQDFYKLCVENQKNNYFLKFLKNNFKGLSVLTRLNLVNFLININFDAKYIKDNLLNADLRNSLNSKNLEQGELYAKLSNKLNSILNPNKPTSSKAKFEEIEANPEIISKQTTSNGLLILSSQGVFNEEKKVELENTSPEDLEEIKEVTLVEENEEDDIKEDGKIIIEVDVEETVIKPIIKEETHIRIVKKREEKAETIPEIPGINKDEVIAFIELLGTNKKENNEFIFGNKFDLKPFEKSEIFKIVRNKINILCDELDYTRLYYLLELAEKIDLFLNLKGLRKKFLNLALKLSKTEKNNTIFKLFLDKYIINN